MALDMFLTIDGIRGESTDAAMRDSLDVLSYSFGVQNSGSSAVGGGGGGAGRPDLTDLSVVVHQSTATVPLLVATAQGRRLDSAVLSVRRAGTTGISFAVTLTGVIVTSVHEGASGGDDRAVDAVSLSFEKVEWSYRTQSRDGALGSPVTGGYDLTQETPTG